MSEATASGSVIARAVSAAARRMAASASAGRVDGELLELSADPALAIRLPDRAILHANAALARFLDLEPGILAGAAAADLAELVHPEDLDRALAMLRLLLREGDGSAVQLACRVRTHGGPWLPARLAFAVAPLPGGDGPARHLVVAMARASSEAGPAGVDRPDGTWVLGPEGLQGDARWAALCGEPAPRDLDDWCARLAPAGARALRGRVVSVLHGLAESMSVDVEIAGGRRLRVWAREAGEGRVVGSVLPLDGAGEAAGWARSLVEELGEGVALVREGTITWASRRLAALLGDSLAGSAVLEWVHPGDMTALADLLREGRGRASVRLLPGEGDALAVEVEAIPVTHAGEPALALVARRPAGAGEVGELIAERRRILGPLLAGLAHEINNPLAYLVLSLDSLEEDLALLGRAVEALAEVEGLPGPAAEVLERWRGAAFGECLRDARDGARRIEEMVAELRAVSTSGAGEGVDLGRLVAVVTRLVQPRIRYEAPAGGGGPRVAGPPGRIGELVLALALLAAGPDEAPARLAVDEAEGRARLRVRGGAAGAPRRRELDACRVLAEELGGELVEGDGPGGWWVEARLPVAAASACEDAPTVTAGPDLRVLLVDDEPVFRRRLAAALGAGFSVVQAGSGDEARERLAGGEPFDLVVTDLVMPGLSGEDLVAWVEARRPELLPRTVVVSGGASAELERRLRADLGVPVMRKPVDVAALRDLLCRLGGRASAERRAAPRVRRPRLAARLSSGDLIEFADVVDVSTRGIRLAPLVTDPEARRVGRARLGLLMPGRREAFEVDAELVRLAEDGGPCFRLRWPDEDARLRLARWLDLEET